MAVELKVCSKCKKEKPITEYYADLNKKSGVHSSCKTCQSDRVQHQVTSKVKRRVEKELAEIPTRVLLQMLREDKVLLGKVLRCLNARRFKQLASLERARIFAEAEENVRKWARLDQIQHIEGGREALVDRRVAALRKWAGETK